MYILQNIYIHIDTFELSLGKKLLCVSVFFFFSPQSLFVSHTSPLIPDFIFKNENKCIAGKRGNINNTNNKRANLPSTEEQKNCLVYVSVFSVFVFS